MKKIVSLIISVIMIVTVFAGCGDNNGNEVSNLYNPDLKIGDTGGLELPLTNSSEEYVWQVASTASNLEESFVVKKMREATGVNLQLMVLPTSTAEQKIKVLAASNDLPDITSKGTSGDFGDQLCVQGAFAAVEDYYDYLPNFRKIFLETEEADYVRKSYIQSDGKLYGFFGWDMGRIMNHGILYRKDIFDKHGIEMWSNPEEFYQVLKKLKQLYPNSTPFVSKNGDSIFQKLAAGWEFWPHNVYYDEEDKQWYFTDILPEYKEYLDYIKKLYNEGLIDPEFLTATQAAWTQSMTQADKAFVTFDWVGRLEQFTTQVGTSVPGYDLRFGNPVGPLQTYGGLGKMIGCKYVKNMSEEREKVAFQLLDFALSPAGRELITMGIEGETYTIGENGKAVYVGFEGKNPEMNELEEKYGMYLEGMYVGFDRRCSYCQYSEREQEAQEYPKITVPDPVLTYTGEEKGRVVEITTEIQKAAKEFAVKYILNKEQGEKEWNAWVKEAEKIGAREWEKLANEAQKRYDSIK